MDGFEMIKAMKREEAIKFIPVICVTATYKDLSSKLKVLLDCGAEEFFYSSENVDELLVKVVVMMRIRKIYLELLEKNKNLKEFNEVCVDRELKLMELMRKVQKIEQELAKFKK
jgi:response regulator RpfG family c-di-GMP phosphodiesterase